LADLLLYTLNGCIDALLQDLRESLNLPLKPHEVSIRDGSKFMRELTLSTDPRAQIEIEWIKKMRDNGQSWLCKLRRYRNRSAHRDPIGGAFQRPVKMPGLVGSDKDFHSYFKETYVRVIRHCREVRERYGKYQPCSILD